MPVLLTTPDSIQIRVPNSEVFGQSVKNYSPSETRRIDLVIGLGYDDDLGLAVHELGDSSVNLVVRPWVSTADCWATRWDLTRAPRFRSSRRGPWPCP